MTSNWHNTAVEVARFIRCEIPEAPRGAFAWHNRMVIVFGNRGDAEVPFVREMLPVLWPEPRELGFATDLESWALLLRAASQADAFKVACGLNLAVWTGYLGPIEEWTDDERSMCEAQLHATRAAVIELGVPMVSSFDRMLRKSLTSKGASGADETRYGLSKNEVFHGHF